MLKLKFSSWRYVYDSILLLNLVELLTTELCLTDIIDIYIFKSQINLMSQHHNIYIDYVKFSFLNTGIFETLSSLKCPGIDFCKLGISVFGFCNFHSQLFV